MARVEKEVKDLIGYMSDSDDGRIPKRKRRESAVIGDKQVEEEVISDEDEMNMAIGDEEGAGSSRKRKHSEEEKRDKKPKKEHEERKEEASEKKMKNKYRKALREHVRLRRSLYTEAVAKEAAETKVRNLEMSLLQEQQKRKMAMSDLNHVKKMLADTDSEVNRQKKKVMREREEKEKRVKEAIEEEKKKSSKVKQSLLSQIEGLQGEIVKLKERAKRMDAELGSVSKENEEIRKTARKREPLQAPMARLHELNLTLTKKVAELEKKKVEEEANGEVKRLKGEVETLNQINFSLSSQLAAAERAAAAAEEWRKDVEGAKVAAEKAELAAATAKKAVETQARNGMPPPPYAALAVPADPTTNGVPNAERLNLRAENDRLRKGRDHWKRAYEKMNAEYSKYKNKVSHNERTPTSISAPKPDGTNDQEIDHRSGVL